jgi:hypothetical protein
MRRAALCAAVALWLLALPVSAQPTLWQRAQAPGSAARAKARLRAEQLFDQASDPRADLATLRHLSLGSAALMELSAIHGKRCCSVACCWTLSLAVNARLCS